MDALKFKQFRDSLQDHVTKMLKEPSLLFVTGTDKDTLWDKYLGSFPPGTNMMFRKRREYDCSCCRHFIKSFGNVVIVLPNNKLASIWDLDIDDPTYKPVADALSAYVKSFPITNAFIAKEATFGTDQSLEQSDTDGTVYRWNHFFVKIDSSRVNRTCRSVGDLAGEIRDVRNVFKRSLDEIKPEAIDIVLDLISQNSLYRGEEWGKVLSKFCVLQTEYSTLSEAERDNFCWRKISEVDAVVGKIRNHSIGTLLIDLSADMGVDEAVRRYEAVVAPTNYKRPKALITKRMIEQAEKDLVDLGLMDSLGRRFATIEDISVNNILFANKDSLRKMTGVFSELKADVPIDIKKYSKVEEVDIKSFIEKILPRTTSMELFLENRHAGNLVSLIAPANKDSKTMFKWGNNFSWAYAGNIADSMKERVKAAGGDVTGILRFSIQWNEDGENQNDFDAHCIEPNGNHIYYPNKRATHPSSGKLDVDIINPGKKVAVENITWTSRDKMQTGKYQFFVHNFSHRGGRSGFSAEIEYNGEIYSFDYAAELKQDERVIVAEITFDRVKGIHFLKSLPTATSSRTLWELKANQFHPVSVCMFSPNYWDGQSQVGNRHVFFMMNGCTNDMLPNGFFNEFLREEFMKHKRVFEVLGGKMRVEPSQSQLSGVGFSSTKRDFVICKLSQHADRVVKILF